MPDIAAAFANAQLIADEALRRRAAKGDDKPRGLAASDVTASGRDGGEQQHCYDPWIICKYVPGSERRAARNLVRDGFEVFYPAGRSVDYLPLNQIPPKKRYRKGYFLRIDLKLPYPGYAFIRPLARVTTSLSRLWELDGVLGICMFGDHLATIEDYRIEMMRVHQDAGYYDHWHPAINQKVWRLAEIKMTDAAKERWKVGATVLGKLDTNQGAVHFIEEFGRITRVVTRTGDQHIGV